MELICKRTLKIKKIGVKIKMTAKTDRFISEYIERFKPAKENNWNYIDGCFINAIIMLYQVTNDTKYKDFVIQYYNNYIDEQGNIQYYDINEYNIDSINSGNGLFFAYDETKDKKYKTAIELLQHQLRTHPRTSTGNFWHKKIYPEQVWLDGLYMGQVFYTRYETKFGGKEHYMDILNQFRNVRKYLYNEDKGLYYHACDMSRKQNWADKETGLSSNFWLRACGWYLMALIDVMDVMDESIYDMYRELGELFKETLKGLLKYRDVETGLFYQVVDHPEVKGNYIETSGSAMIAYSIFKACRMKILLKEKYQGIAHEMLNALTELKIREENGVLRIGDICKGAGLSDKRDGSIEYYLSEPVVYDDHKGAAPYIMTYAESLRL